MRMERRDVVFVGGAGARVDAIVRGSFRFLLEVLVRLLTLTFRTTIRLGRLGGVGVFE